MRYGFTTLATDFKAKALNDWRVRFLKAALFFVPRANPDIERLYPKVKRWALELSDDGWPQREIGLSSEGTALFCTPNDRNTGLWTDMARRQFVEAELQSLSANEFERFWQSVPGVGA